MHQKMNRRKIAVAVLMTGALAATAVGAATADTANRGGTGTTVAGQLNPLNNSGAAGRAEVHVHNRRLNVHVNAHGLAADLPHAQHIHFGKKARHECPSAFDDTNGDFRLTTAEGLPAYGPVRVSLTKTGATGPGSVLAVDRFPTAPDGHVRYHRMTRTKEGIARGIRRGNAVVVIHGVDYNANGAYDFDSAGASELDPSLPAEATDPAVCGVLHR